MGWGSAGTPPWVDEKEIDQEKKEKEILECRTRIKFLEEENRKLEEEIKNLKNALKKK